MNKDFRQEILDRQSQITKNIYGQFEKEDILEKAKSKVDLVEKGEGAVEEAMKHKDKLGEGAKKRESLDSKDKVEAVMKEWRQGTLHSGSGEKVTDRKQAIAIAMSEAGLEKAELDENKLSQEEVNYQFRTPEPDEFCGICINFEKKDSCKRVEGKISKGGYCNIFDEFEQSNKISKGEGLEAILLDRVTKMKEANVFEESFRVDIERDLQKSIETLSSQEILDYLKTYPNISKSEESELEQKPISKENKEKIEEYIKENPNLDDSDFHNFAIGLGIDKHEAEEVVYSILNKKLNEEKIEGGKGDRKTLQDIADLHGVELSEIEKEFEVGVKVEMEHGNKEKAEEIAKDHLTKNPKYYSQPMKKDWGKIEISKENIQKSLDLLLEKKVEDDIKGEKKEEVEEKKDEGLDIKYTNQIKGYMKLHPELTCDEICEYAKKIGIEGEEAKKIIESLTKNGN